MNVRNKLAELTAGITNHVELDAFVSRNGGLRKILETHFPGAAADEFLYEWDSRKLAFRGRPTKEG